MDAADRASSVGPALNTAPTQDTLSAHRPYLLRFARRRLRDAALVEDVVQETLLAALQGADRFEHKAALRTWLTGILLHRIADHVRRSNHFARPAANSTVVTNDADEAPGNDHRDEPIEWRDPQRLLEGRQSIAALANCFDGLPALAARALSLREIDGWSNDEIARELSVTPAYCAVLLHRARARLRDCLAGS